MYDELRMITSCDIKAENDVVFVTFLNHKLDSDAKYGHRTLPLRNSMQMTEVEYREFLSSWGFTMTYLKKWVNEDVLVNGIQFPYTMEEFYTTLKFKEKSMHLMLEVEKSFSKIFDGRV